MRGSRSEARSHPRALDHLTRFLHPHGRSSGPRWRLPTARCRDGGGRRRAPGAGLPARAERKLAARVCSRATAPPAIPTARALSGNSRGATPRPPAISTCVPGASIGGRVEGPSVWTSSPRATVRVPAFPCLLGVAGNQSATRRGARRRPRTGGRSVPNAWRPEQLHNCRVGALDGSGM